MNIFTDTSANVSGTSAMADFSAASWRTPRAGKIFMALLFLLALLLRLGDFWLEGQISRDGIGYLMLARNWYETGVYQNIWVQDGLTPWVPPMLPAILRGWLELGLSPELFGALTNILLGALLVIPIFLLAHELTGNMFFACMTGLFIACNPELCDNSRDILREPAYLLACAMMLLTGCRAGREGGRRIVCWAWCGFWLAAAMLSRLEAVEFLLLVPLYLCYLRFAGKINTRRMLGAWLIFLVAAAATLAAAHWALGTELQLFQGVSRMAFHLTGGYL